MGEDKVESLAVHISPTIRGIVNVVNKEGIKREDIITILKEGEQFVLLYFK